jgi:hypothetical protein
MEHNEHIERLIGRRVDGELSSDEMLELDRALIRSPESRRILDETMAIDGLCGEVLSGITECEGGASKMSDRVFDGGGGRRSRGRVWYAIPGAVAACLVWLGWATFFETVGTTQPVVVVEVPSSVESGGLTVNGSESRPLAPIGLPGDYRNASTGFDVTDGVRGTNVFTVLGEDGNIYLVRVDRLQTMRRPTTDGRVPVVLGDF